MPVIEWLSQTPLSLAIQTRAWVVPTIQSIHIVAIGIVVTSVFMIDLRVLGWGGRDQTLVETVDRFGPWLSWALGVLLITGLLMVVGEPARELLSFSFWLKMALVAIGTLITAAFRIAVRRNERRWEDSLVKGRITKSLAILTLLIWACIIVLGRLIAYDHIWGAWSMSPKA
jgi:putative copper export protein